MATRGIAELRVAGTDYNVNDPNIANEFSTGTNYLIGDCVNYQGALCEFTTNHPAGAWNSSHVKIIKLSKENSRTKHAMASSGIFQVNVERGYVNTSGVESNDNQKLRTGLIDVSGVDYIGIFLQSDFRMLILYYNADGTYAGSSSDYGDVRTTTRWFDVSTRAKIRCIIINKNPPSGYVIPLEAAQYNYAIVFKSTNNYIASFWGHYIEEDSSGVYLRWTSNLWLRGSITLTIPATDDSGLTLVDSPLGVENCVYIENNKSLVFNATDKSLDVVDTETLIENDTQIDLLSIITMLDHKGKAKGLLVDVIADAERIYNRKNRILSLTYQNEPYFEYAGTSGVYFNLNGGKGWIRGYDAGQNWDDMDDIPLADGISLTTSPMGKTNCILIPHNNSMILVPFTNTVYIVPNADMWKYPYSILIFQVIGNQGHDVITNGIGNRNIHYVNDSDGIKIDSGNIFHDFSAAFSSVGANVEPFMFFSDPHVMGEDNTFNSRTVADFVNSLRFGYENTPTSFIVDGGDWLNKDDYVDGACYKLGIIDGIMRKNFQNYYPANGNHDFNAYGTISEEDSSDGDLSLDTMKALHYRENGKLYYAFDGTITKNYVFDSGNHHVTTMNAYRWEQLDWFAKKLIEDDSPYAVVWVHVAFTDYTTFDPTQISTFMQTVGQVIEAYNDRESITLNGETYDFSGKTGKVWAIMCGHTHYDMNYTIGGIPVVSVINAVHSGVVSYDLGFFDFDNSKLKLFRIGSGSNRTFNL